MWNTRKHGCSYPVKWPEYDVWRNMRYRCYRESLPNYKWYGGRGIQVCDRWNASFENFILDMGKRPSAKHSIDRINNDGNYEPENCRWATLPEQIANKNRHNQFSKSRIRK